MHTPMSYETQAATIWLWSKDYWNPHSLKQLTALISGHLFNWYWYSLLTPTERNIHSVHKTVPMDPILNQLI